MKVYLIPGLGFDDRTFARLDLGELDFEYLNWIEPKKGESLKEYAQRFCARMEMGRKGIVLIGHSLGGVLAQEIATITPIHKIILVSSIKSRQELPKHFKVVQPLQVHRLFSKGLTAKTIRFWGKHHDYETREEQSLMVNMVNKHSNRYLRWALRQLSIWKSPDVPEKTKVFQIHGDSDKTFPIKLIKDAGRIIEKGGHFMVYRKATLLSELILNECQN